MNRLTSAFLLIAAMGLGPLVATPVATGAGEGTDAVQAQARFRPRIAERQVQTILARIRSNTETLLRTIDGVAPRGQIYSTRTRTADDLAYLVDDLLRATSHLEDHIARQLTTRADVDDVLRRAVMVDQALGRTSSTRVIQDRWTGIRRDIDSLASGYGLRWDWSSPEYSTDPVTGVYGELRGTYTLEPARSDNPARVIDTALRTVPASVRDRAERQLTNRLNPPEVVAIDRSGNQILIASSHGPQLSFDANGQAQTEEGARGQTITTRASTYGDQLYVTTTGLADNEFAVTFEPLDGGRQLRVTRRIYTNALRDPVTLQSVYRRTSETPDWNLYNRPVTRPNRPGRAGVGVLVPDGTTFVARLDQTVNLRTAREDDRITLTVRDSSQASLNGATIEGTIVTPPTGITDRPRVSIRFDQIRLANGQMGDFDGVIERITGPNGQAITFDGEQATVDRSQRTEALRRGAIGAIIGGIIGAVAGGGEGALIGAAIGGGGAAATVLLDSSGQPELVRGTEFTIRARGE